MLQPVMAQEPAPTPAPTTPAAPPSQGEQPPPPPPPPPGETTVPVPPTPGTPARTRTAHIRFERAIFSTELGLYQFYGNVTIEVDTVVIRASEATYNDEAQLMVARGIVSIRPGDGNTYWGNVLEYDLRARQWRFLDWSVQYPAGYLGAPFIAPVYVSARVGTGPAERLESSGLPRALHAQDARITTCTLAHPHYLVTAAFVDIYPGDKLLAKDCDFYVLDRRILHLPWFFLSLRQKRSPIVPETGKNDFEGYYLRLLYQYALAPDQLGGVRLDLTQKLGVGTGINHFYTVPRGDGEAFLYGRQGLKEYVLRVDHHQQLPANIAGEFKVDVRRDSRFTIQPTTLTDANVVLRRPGLHSNSLLSYTRRLNQGVFSSDNTSANLRYDFAIPSTTFRYSGTYTQFAQVNAVGNPPADQEAWNRVQLTRRFSFADLNVLVDDRSDLDRNRFTGDNQFGGVERLPEVYLQASQQQLRAPIFKQLRSVLTLGWGAFHEMPAAVTLNRYRFQWDATPNQFTLGPTVVTSNAAFRQTVYGDQDTTALYYYTAGLSARSPIGPVSNVLNYRRQSTNGFTPFSFDYVYPYETINDSLQFIRPGVEMYLTSGRDLRQDRWQDITFRANAQLAPRITTRQLVGFDPNTHRWRDLVSEYHWLNDPRTTLNLSTRYDINNHKLSNVSGGLEWVITPVWRLQWLGGYDALNKQLLYNEYLLTRDLHCWDASIYYSYQRRYVYLYLRLKALNLPLPEFGIGRAGQVLSSSQPTPL